MQQNEQKKEMMYLEDYLDKNGKYQSRIVLLDMQTGQERFADFSNENLLNILGCTPEQAKAPAVVLAMASLKIFLSRHSYDQNEPRNEEGLYGIQINHKNGTYMPCDLEKKFGNGFAPLDVEVLNGNNARIYDDVAELGTALNNFENTISRGNSPAQSRPTIDRSR